MSHLPGSALLGHDVYLPLHSHLSRGVRGGAAIVRPQARVAPVPRGAAAGAREADCGGMSAILCRGAPPPGSIGFCAIWDCISSSSSSQAFWFALSSLWFHIEVLWGFLMNSLSAEFSWMMDLLGPDCPGDGMDIPKFHDFLNSVRMLREFCSLMNACTGPFERRHKLLKQNDLRTVRSRSSDRGVRLFKRQQSTEIEFAALPPPDSTGGKGGRITKGRVRCSVGEGSTWNVVLTDLGAGLSGPALPSDVVGGLGDAIQVLVSEGAAEVKEVFFTEAQVVDGIQNEYIIRPGHCIEMNGGTFAQVAVPVIKQTAFAASDLHFAVLPFDFVNAAHLGGGHPEAPGIPWLKRCSLGLIPVGQVKRRIHIIKLRGNIGRLDGDTDEHFLLKTFMFPNFRGPVERAIYLSCPFECGGRLEMPGTVGSLVGAATGAAGAAAAAAALLLPRPRSSPRGS